ncbi:hypothetical protein [Crateriforma conspicua]|uniref:Thioredoxin domain-containing protein n=1 Tax=Crateriforma conspicua TaxID=2527996 RepID=A0A5C5XZZ2_9PLAN|nr:hypothetical protein [Crateriforma conspicua]QDV62680.1 hypothetical protein Mal65_18150 [Crateriforma conspicua]TWT68550.1 hypothetical protein Pan14r_07960 [Crateriforma conspicua]
MKRTTITTRLLAAFTAAVLCLVSADPIQAATDSASESFPEGPAGVAMRNAAAKGKYLFVYFWKQADQPTQTMRAVFEKATAQMNDVADAISVRITDAGNADIVKKFDVSRAPMPLALAIAPNGAITRGLPVKFDDQQLKEAVVSRGTSHCLKAMQDRKLVLLCVKHQTGPNDFPGAYEFTQDERYSAASQIVRIDPSDSSEHGFLQSLKIDPSADQGVMVVMSPPGQPVATFTADATKDQIIKRLAAASASCCPGGQCGPGESCCPGGNCEPAAK